MNGITRECRTDLRKEFLDAAVGRRGNLGPLKILYELTHVDILNKKMIYWKKLLRYRVQQPSFCEAQRGVSLCYGKEQGQDRSKRKKNCSWIVNNSCSWSCNALNGGLSVRTAGHLIGGHPLAFTFTLYRPNLFHNGGKNWVFVFFRLIFQFNNLQVEESRLL